jgi:hypothetical protein
MLVAGCNNTPATRHIEIDLQLQASTCGMCDSPDNCPLSCGGGIGVFIVKDGSILESSCFLYDPMVPPATTGVLNALPQLLQMNASLPQLVEDGTIFDAELEVFDGPMPPDFVSSCSEPQRATFQPGSPIPTLELPDGSMLVPRYYGVAHNQALGPKLAAVEIPLSCISANAGCSAPPMPIHMTTVVEDMTSLVPPDVAQSDNLDVHTGKIVFDTMQSPLEATFTLGDHLTFNDSTIDPKWMGMVSQMPDPACVATLVTPLGTGSTYGTLSCEGSATGDPVTAQSYVVDKKQVDLILSALSLPTLPDRGLLIGKVIDPLGSEAAGAVVSAASDPSAQIVYFDNVPDPEMPGQTILVRNTTRGSTGPNGYFVVSGTTPLDLDATGMHYPMFRTSCCDYFNAARAADGTMGHSAGRVGLVDGLIMSTVIQLK